MQPPPRYFRTPRSRLLLAVAVALLGRGGVARAEAMTTPHFDAEAHARDCRCAARCRGDACCCGRSQAARRPASHPSPAARPQRVSSDRRARGDVGPCLGEAPCGDPGLPTSTPPGPGARAAAILASSCRRPMTAGRLLHPADSGRATPGRPSRLDRPPRG